LIEIEISVAEVMIDFDVSQIE